MKQYQLSETDAPSHFIYVTKKKKKKKKSKTIAKKRQFKKSSPGETAAL